PHVSAQANCAWRTDRSRTVVGAALFHSRTLESTTRKPYRLDLVHRFAGRVWRCGRTGGRAPIAHADPRKPVLCHPCRCRSSRNDFAAWGRKAVNSFRYLSTFAAMSVMLLCACSSPPGMPAKDSEELAPSQISDFKILYAENCAGCHGTDGRGGAAIAL